MELQVRTLKGAICAVICIASSEAVGGEVSTGLELGGGVAVPMCSLIASSAQEFCAPTLLPRGAARVSLDGTFPGSGWVGFGVELRQGVGDYSGLEAPAAATELLVTTRATNLGPLENGQSLRRA
jgi:hypothetical protein